MFFSSGLPGSILFLIPSSPAITSAEKHRYGLAEGSGGRNSIRRAFGFSEYIGIRTAADRFRLENARFTGASYPGTSRLYELVVGAANARIALACLSSPPMYHLAVSDSSAYPFAS